MPRDVTEHPPPAPTAARSRRGRSILGGVLAVLAGLAIVRAVYGGHILPPAHTGWMLSGRIGPDPVQYWLGYTFFKRTEWGWPPGLNPGWGMELSSSIFYADAIPLLAFLFKALDPLVEVAQYWGLWLYACGALQALLSWRLIGLGTTAMLPRLAGAALFVLQPVLLHRMGGHFALGGQFVLLAALLLCLTRGTGWRRLASWTALVLATALIHAYLLVMVAGLWAADWLARAADPPRRSALLAAEALAAPGAGLLGLWAAGFFVLSEGFGGTWGGFGRMQFDLLAPLDPSYWGAFLPDLPGPDHLEAGSSYAGLGTLLLLAAGALAWAARPRPFLRAWWPLLLALAAFLALAVTHRVSIGGREVVLFELSAAVLRYADALRASERFLWPVAYAALTAAALTLVRVLGARRAGLVLAAALAVQIADLRPGFARLAHFFAPEPAVVPLRLGNPFWTEAARRYSRIRVVPNRNQAAWWEEVAVYAATMGLETDAVYLARLDPRRVARLNAAMAERLGTGRFEPCTLYVLGDAGAIALARASRDPDHDLLEMIDLLMVLAPGWWSVDDDGFGASACR
ncbi:DUF6311 domain-containing protein [Elioraea sp.]|uniref:DUF6311 domain-containing protein n=1 Tax=Elioraea sp. TaxID=2185103 RepID=UPI00307D007F